VKVKIKIRKEPNSVSTTSFNLSQKVIEKEKEESKEESKEEKIITLSSFRSCPFPSSSSKLEKEKKEVLKEINSTTTALIGQHGEKLSTTNLLNVLKTFEENIKQKQEQNDKLLQQLLDLRGKYLLDCKNLEETYTKLSKDFARNLAVP
jgi:DNA phosphorothioation-dependent restriction protein DptG